MTKVQNDKVTLFLNEILITLLLHKVDKFQDIEIHKIQEETLKIGNHSNFPLKSEEIEFNNCSACLIM